jgi:polar amino acid transport system substrate-binding protein
MRMKAAILALTIGLAGCGDFPKDARGTLDRLKGGDPMRVGYAAAEPWVRSVAEAEPAGVEADLVRAWAASLPARLEWVPVSQTQLAEALKAGSVDLGIGGFAERSPWAGAIGQTQPYWEARVMIGMAPGTATPAFWRDAEIRYDRRRPHFADLIAAVGAKPIAADPGALAPIGAAYAEELPGLGLAPTRTVLATEPMVIATPAAENALTLALDRFLHGRKQDIAAALASGARS